MRFTSPNGYEGRRIGRLPCPTRDEVRSAVACPTCGAPIEAECFSSPTASRDKNHIARVKLAIEVLGPMAAQR